MKGMEIDPALQQFLQQPLKPAKRTIITSPSGHRKHNHYPMGKMGYNPKLARLAHHDKPKGGRNK